MTALEIIQKYISFFETRGHKRIANSPLVPQNDPTTLFTSSGMQPLVPYLLGEKHPMGTKLVNVQNSFRAQDIDEIGDNRHTTFFRMLGNWSLGDYFKKEQLTWFFEFLTSKTEGLGLNPEKLFVTAFIGNVQIPQDQESIEIWKKLFKEKGIDAKLNEKIFLYDIEKNWWSRSGTPDKMPVGEIGGTDSEVFYDFGKELKIHENSQFKNSACHPNCDCGRFMEIGNSVFMQYKKSEKGFEELPKKNVDFGGGLERLLAAVEDQNDIFQTSLRQQIVRKIEWATNSSYQENKKNIRIITDHLVASVLIASNKIAPSNKEQGYILRRLIRRAMDNLTKFNSDNIIPILEAIITEYKKTDPKLETNYEFIKNTILEEARKYNDAVKEAKKFIKGKYKKTGDDLMGITEISSDDAFILYTTHGLSPAQIKSLGYIFNDQEFAEKMKEHQSLSRKGAEKKFRGGLADHSEKTIMGHTATHLLHQALRDALGTHVHQSGSNITSERVRFDFNFERNLTPEELKKVENIVNEKIKENLPVHFEMLPLKKAKEIGAIGLFDDKYEQTVKIYFIGHSTRFARSGQSHTQAYSIEFCGGPHVTFTSQVKSFKIIKQENIGRGQRRLYALVGD